jgi:putative molybdopterin biosynthesis protein
MADKAAAGLGDYLTVPEAASFLRISPRKVYDLVSRSGLPHQRAGGRLLFERSRLSDWLRGNGLERGMPAPPLVLSGSHDALLDWAVRASRAALATLCRGSRDGLERMRRGEACAALLHLPERVTGPGLGGFNVDAVTKALDRHDVALINWCWRQQGLIVARDNPFGIRTLDDLMVRTGGRRPRIGRRSAGAGSRELFDQLMAERVVVNRDDPEMDLAIDNLESENDAAMAVRLGQADAVLGAQSAAQSVGLGFVPIIRERVDLLINRRSYFEPPLQALLAFCRTPSFAAHAQALGGYELAEHGTVIWNGD